MQRKVSNNRHTCVLLPTLVLYKAILLDFFFFFFFQHYPSSVSFHWSSWLEFSGKFASCNAVRNTCSCASKFSHLCKSLFTSNSELCSLVFSSFVCVSNASHLMEYSLFFCSTRSCCILTSSSSVSSSETVLSSEEIKNK